MAVKKKGWGYEGIGTGFLSVHLWSFSKFSWIRCCATSSITEGKPALSRWFDKMTSRDSFQCKLYCESAIQRQLQCLRTYRIFNPKSKTIQYNLHKHTEESHKSKQGKAYWLHTKAQRFSWLYGGLSPKENTFSVGKNVITSERFPFDLQKTQIETHGLLRSRKLYKENKSSFGK